MSNALRKIFDVEPVTVITPDDKEVVVVEEGDEDQDFIYARARSYELAEKGHEALDVAMRVVREAESPAAITALSGLIKTLSDVNKNLLSLNKDKADAKIAKAGKGHGASIGTAIQHQTNIFSSSSKDLNKLLKQHNQIHENI